jgi:hypothetical protein
VRQLEQITRPFGEHRCRQAFVCVHGPVEIGQLGTVVQPACAQDEAVPELTWQPISAGAIRHENHRPPRTDDRWNALDPISKGVARRG